MQSLLHQKANALDFEEFRRALEKIFREIDDKVTLREFEEFINKQSSQIDEMQKEVLMKANIKDVCSLLDQKSSNLPKINCRCR